MAFNRSRITGARGLNQLQLGGRGKTFLNRFPATNGGGGGTVFPTWAESWRYRVKVVAQPGMISGVNADFPFYFNLNNLTNTAFWSNVRADGGDLRVGLVSNENTQVPTEVVGIDKLVETGEIHFKSQAGIPDNPYSMDIDADMTKLSGALVDVSMYFNLANINDNLFWDNVKADGGDLRIWKREGDQSRLGLEVVNIDTVGKTGEIYFRGPLWDGVSVLPDGPNKFRLEWGDPAGTQPAANAPFGSYQAWGSGRFRVYHLNETSGTNVIDSSGGGGLLFGTYQGNLPTPVNSPLGNGQFFDGAGDYASFNNVLFDLSNYPRSYSITFRTTDANDTFQTLFSNGDSVNLNARELLQFGTVNKSLIYFVERGGNSISLIADDKPYNDGLWHTVVVNVISASNWELYVDGVLKDSSTTTLTGTGLATKGALGVLDRTITDRFFQGEITEARFNTVEYLTGTPLTEYNNLLDNQNFWQLSPAVAIQNEFFIYWGNPLAGLPLPTDTFGRNNVWSPNHNTVQHQSDLLFVDSSGTVGNGVGNNLDASNIIDATVGKAISYNGIDESLNLGAILNYTDAQPYSFSLAVRIDNTSANQFIFKKSTVGNNRMFQLVYIAGTGIRYEHFDNVAASFSVTSGNVVQGQWYHIFISYNGTSITMWMDGVDQGSSGAVATISDAPLQDLQIALNTATNTFYNISLDLLKAIDSKDVNWALTEYNNLMNNPNFWGDYQYQVNVSIFPSAYDQWSFRIPFYTDNTKVLASLADFPHMASQLTIQQLPPGDAQLFWDRVKPDGGDIIVTDDIGTRMPVEIVGINVANKTLELHFKDNTDNSANKLHFLYFGNAAATQPPVTDPFGRNEVWDATRFRAVWHNSDLTGLDSTGNNNTYSPVNTPTIVDSTIGKGLDFDDTNPDGMEMDAKTGTFWNDSIGSISMWVKRNIATRDVSEELFSVSNVNAGQVSFFDLRIMRTSDPDANQLVHRAIIVNGGAATTVAGTTLINNTDYHYIAIVASNIDITLWINGVKEAVSTNVNNFGYWFSDLQNRTHNFVLGQALLKFDTGYNAANRLNGIINEMRISQQQFGSNFLGTEYNNQGDEPNFYIVSPLQANAISQFPTP